MGGSAGVIRVEYLRVDLLDRTIEIIVGEQCADRGVLNLSETDEFFQFFTVLFVGDRTIVPWVIHLPL